MKTKIILTLIITLLLKAAVWAQPSPVPPAPPAPPSAPIPPERREKLPKVPVTFLGVETSDIPRVVSEQLGLAKGFGLVVDYVVPDGPAATAGVQQNDILKMLNDQILTEPEQLSKLIRSFSEGTTVTLTVLRKGQEQKIPVKLSKKEVPQRRWGGPGSHMPGDFHMGDMDLGDMRDWMKDLKEQMTDGNKNMMHDTVMRAQEEVAHAREHAQEQAERIREQAQRVRENAQARHGQIRITRSDGAGLRTTRIDIAKAQIVFSDDKGELRLDSNNGKRILTAKDPQGRLLFSGPVETKEDLEKVPADVRDRYNQLQQKDLPAVVSPEDNDDDNDADETDEDEGDGRTIEQVSCPQSLDDPDLIGLRQRLRRAS